MKVLQRRAIEQQYLKEQNVGAELNSETIEQMEEVRDFVLGVLTGVMYTGDSESECYDGLYLSIYYGFEIMAQNAYVPSGAMNVQIYTAKL